MKAMVQAILGKTGEQTSTGGIVKEIEDIAFRRILAPNASVEARAEKRVASVVKRPRCACNHLAGEDEEAR